MTTSRRWLLAVATVTILVAGLLVTCQRDRRMESRAPQWPRVRDAYLAEHPTCAACGTARELTAHHVEPVSRGGAELDPDNLIALCPTCHWTFGHLCSWRSFNPDVRCDAAAFLEKVRARPPPERK